MESMVIGDESGSGGGNETTSSSPDICLERTWFNNELVGDELDLCPRPANSTDEDFNTFFFYQTEQLAFLWILLILIVVGNMAVLLALGMSGARKSRMNYFIKHLAIADLSVGVISVLTDIVWKITVAWHAGNIACKVIRFSQVLVTYSSTYVLVALSIDRYDAICHPMNFSRGWRRARILIAAAWILSALFSTPMLVLYEEGLVQGQVQCWIDLPSAWQWQLYLTLVAVSLLVLPALLIFACYIVIVRTIWVQSAALTMASPTHRSAAGRSATAGGGGSGAAATVAMLDEDQESRRASSRGIIPRAKIKTVKMTFVIVFVFILCWAPYIVFDLLQVYGYIPKSKTMIAVATFIQSLAPLNSAANPLIYCLFSTHLCRNLRKIPALEWLACKLEDAARSIGLCPPEWSCCAADGGSLHETHRPSFMPQQNCNNNGTARPYRHHHYRNNTNHHHYNNNFNCPFPIANGNHRQASSHHQFRGPFRRLANNSSSNNTNSSQTTTTTSTTNSTSSTLQQQQQTQQTQPTVVVETAPISVTFLEQPLPIKSTLLPISQIDLPPSPPSPPPVSPTTTAPVNNSRSEWV